MLRVALAGQGEALSGPGFAVACVHRRSSIDSESQLMVLLSRLEEGLLVLYRHFLVEPLQLQGQLVIALGLDL